MVRGCALPRRDATPTLTTTTTTAATTTTTTTTAPASPLVSVLFSYVCCRLLRQALDA